MKSNPKPLEGLRVVDLTRFLAGPYCTMLLGGLGAEVIKIESPNGGDIYRDRAPFGGPQGVSKTRQTPEDVGMGLLHRSRNKKSVTINLRDPEGQALLRKLCEDVDVVVENFSPGVLANMGCDYDTLKAINPKLILCSISGFGQNGPLRDWRAFDPIAQAMSGIMSITGYADKAPVRCGAAIADTVAPLVAIIGIFSALLRRGVTGRGDWVDVAMLDVLTFLLPEVVEYFQADMLDVPLENRHPGGVPFNTFEASDGHVCVAVITDKDWRCLLNAIERADLIDDPRFATLPARRENDEEVEAITRAWIARHTRDEVISRMQAHTVVCGPVLSLTEMLDNAQLKHRGMVTGLQLANGQNVPGAIGLGLPINFADNPIHFDGPAPALGAHTEEILSGVAGLDLTELAKLRDRGVV